jgi:hypothetical protein
MDGDEDHTTNMDETNDNGYHDTRYSRYVNIYPALIWYLQVLEDRDRCDMIHGPASATGRVWSDVLCGAAAKRRAMLANARAN